MKSSKAKIACDQRDDLVVLWSETIDGELEALDSSNSDSPSSSISQAVALLNSYWPRSEKMRFPPPPLLPSLFCFALSPGFAKNNNNNNNKQT